MLKKHYSPGIPIIIGKNPSKINMLIFFLGKKYKNKNNYFNLSKKADLKEAAANLYKIMRKIKKKVLKKFLYQKYQILVQE